MRWKFKLLANGHCRQRHHHPGTQTCTISLQILALLNELLGKPLNSWKVKARCDRRVCRPAFFIFVACYRSSAARAPAGAAPGNTTIPSRLLFAAVVSCSTGAGVLVYSLRRRSQTGARSCECSKKSGTDWKPGTPDRRPTQFRYQVPYPVP